MKSILLSHIAIHRNILLKYALPVLHYSLYGSRNDKRWPVTDNEDKVLRLNFRHFCHLYKDSRMYGYGNADSILAFVARDDFFWTKTLCEDNEVSTFFWPEAFW